MVFTTELTRLQRKILRLAGDAQGLRPLSSQAAG